MDTFTNYNITHANDGNETYSIPINGLIKDFPTFIDLQNNIKDNGFFSMSENFSFLQIQKPVSTILQLSLQQT